jgi:predicted metalloprotease
VAGARLTVVRRRSGWRRPGFAVGVAAVAIGAAAGLIVMAVGAIVPQVGGVAVAAERIDPAAGAPVPVHVVNGFESGDDLLAAAVFGDLQTFWGAELPRLGTEFQALRGGYASVDGSGAGGGALCVSPASTMLGNAYYCRADDGIVYDSAALVPVLLDHYGTAGLTASLAHEFGHAVQARLAAAPGSQASSPAILQEAQADCSAGAFLAWLAAADGGAAGSTGSSAVSTGSSAVSTGSVIDVTGVAADHLAVHLPPGSLLRAVTPLIEFRDPADTVVTGGQAHGLGLDRLRAALAGIRGGAAACPSLTVEGLHLTEGRIRGVDTSKPRFASDTAVDRAAVESVRAFDPTALPDDGSAAAAPDDLRAAAPFGQFARAATIALAAGNARFGTDRPAAAACYLGAWTGFVYGKADTGQLGSWPGDADEAMDMVRSRPRATLEGLAAFATGFDEGLPSCD